MHQEVRRQLENTIAYMNQVHWGDYAERAERIAATLELAAAGDDDRELLRALRAYERLIRRTGYYAIDQPRHHGVESARELARRTAPPKARLPVTVRRPNVGALRATLSSTLETLRSIENYGVLESIESLLKGEPEGILTKGQLRRLQNQQELACILVRDRQRQTEAKGQTTTTKV